MGMATEVQRNAEQSRYELLVDGELMGIADYQERGNTVIIPHTEIERSRRGQGLGAVMVRLVLDDLRGAGRSVVPACWYVAQFIDEHPEYQDLVAA
jgi:uncharacterized protein